MWMFVGEEEDVLPAASVDLSFKTALPQGFAVTRPEAMLARSSTDGRWTSVAANTARFDRDPITRESKGVLVEPGATQLVFKSRAPQYATVRATSTLDATAQTPFGLGALKLVPDTTAGQIHGFNFYYGSPRSSAVADGQTLAVHFVFKPVGAFPNAYVQIQTRDGAFSAVYVSTLNGGSVLTNPIPSAFKALSITPDTDGFWAIKAVFNAGAGTVAPLFSVSFANTTPSRLTTGDGTSHMLVAYLGTELGDSVTTPILTDGTVPFTRQHESLVGTVNWIADTAVSFGLEYACRTPAAATIIEVSANGTTANSLQLAQQGNGETTYYVNRDGVNVCADTDPTPTVGVLHTAVLTSVGDDFRAFIDGSRHAIDSNGGAPAGLNTIAFGATAAGVARGPVTISRLKYWPSNLTDYMAKQFSSNLSIEGVAPDLPKAEIQPTLTALPSEPSITLTIVLDGTLSGGRVDYRTIDGTAKSGTDYSGTTGTLYFAPSQSAQQVTILLGDRSLLEDRSFTFDLLRPVDLALGNASCVITLNRIIQQGAPPTSPYDFGTALSADWLVTRASTANTRNSSGIWTSVATNAPRIHYHAPGVSGLLIEGVVGEQRLYDSVDPALAVVEATKTIVTSEQTATGTRQLQWRKAASALEHKLTGQFGTGVADMPTAEITLWFMVRPVNHTDWKLRVKGIDNVWREVRYDLTNAGAITAADSGAAGYIERDTFNAAWYRIGMNRTQAATANVTAEFELIPVDGGGSSSLIGDTSHGIDICHIQLEPAAGMSSPLMVQGASAKTSRAAETVKADATKTWFKLATFSVGIKFIRLRNQPAQQRVLQMRDTSASSTNDEIGIQTFTGQIDYNLKIGNTTLPTTRTAASTLTNGVPATALMVVDDLNFVAAYHNGTKIAQHAITVGPNPMGVVRLGATEPSGLNPGPVLIQQIYHWSHALSEEDALLFSGNLSYSPAAPPKPVVSIPANLTVKEGDFIDVVITKSGVGPCQIGFRTKAGTAKLTEDYTGVPPVSSGLTYLTVAFLSGETTKTVRVQTAADTTADSGDQFSILLALLDDSCTLGPSAGTVTILEAAQVMVPAELSATEGQSFSITILKTGSGACSIDYRTRAQTAALSDDYTGIPPVGSGLTTLTATFAENETSKVIPITIVNDGQAESPEYFNFELSNPVGCTLGNGTCKINILDPGETPPPAGQLYTTPITFAHTDGNNAAVDFGVGSDPYYVTSLADNATAPAAGTLRHAMLQNNKVIVFEVGGVINIPIEGIRCSGDNLLIAGETAPSPGITIRGGQFIATNANKVCVRHITFECGYDLRQENFVLGNSSSDSDTDVIKISGGSGNSTKNVWFDHCAVFWGNDENIQLWNNGGSGVIERISFTNCLISEGLYDPPALTNPATGKPYKGHWQSGEPESLHNYGVIIGYSVQKVDFQYCVITDMYWRNIWVDADTSVVISNMIGLNNRIGAHLSCNGNDFATYTNTRGPTLLTLDGYLAISGPNTGNNHTGWKFHNGSTSRAIIPTGPNGTPTSKFWVKNLYAMKGAGADYKTPIDKIVSRNDTTTLLSAETAALVSTSSTSTRPTDIPNAPVAALSKEDMYDRACLNVGPRPKERAQPNVSRKIRDLKNKDSKWINHQSDVGGFPTVTSTTRNLRNGTAKFADGVTAIPPFPATVTDKPAVRAWLRRFLDDVQYD